ncbi:hypothetical protein ACHAWO_005037 [Cyclotella atomus]|uniref:Uncharacterized protein n=1 Tax=Cyclotella atomus TaxID=382360 RepID=A0ABD3PCY0_9STRA
MDDKEGRVGRPPGRRRLENERVERDIPPDDSQQTSSQSHPHYTHSRWYTGNIFTKMKLGQKESKG